MKTSYLDEVSAMNNIPFTWGNPLLESKHVQGNPVNKNYHFGMLPLTLKVVTASDCHAMSGDHYHDKMPRIAL